MSVQENGQDTVLLYRDGPEVSFKAFLERLNAELSDTQVAFRPAPLSSDCFALFTHDRMQLTVSVNLAPLPPGIVGEALVAPMSRLRSFDFQRAVERHRATIRLSLTDAPEPGSPEQESADDISMRLVILHRALLALIEIAPPTAVYWRQSDMMFTPDEVECTRGAAFPAPLVLHPIPLDGPASAPGLRAGGSAVFCGKTLVVAAGAMSLSASIAVCERMVEQAVTDNRPLPDGSELPFRPGQVIRISHSDDVEDEIIVSIEPKQCASEPAAPAPVLQIVAENKTIDDGQDHAVATVPPPAKADRADTWRSYTLCVGMILMFPPAAFGMAAYNLLRGPNLVATAGVFSMVLAFYIGSAALDLAQALSETQQSLIALNSTD